METILSDKELERRIETLALIPSDGGRFEFSVNSKTLFSKLELQRHAEDGELHRILKKSLGV